jgi:hypothetical protein
MYNDETCKQLIELQKLVHDARPKGKKRVEFEEFNQLFNDHPELFCIGLTNRIYLYCKYLDRQVQDSFIEYVNQSHSKRIPLKKKFQYRTASEKRGKFQFVVFTEHPIKDSGWYVFGLNTEFAMVSKEMMDKIQSIKVSFLKNQI